MARHRGTDIVPWWALGLGVLVGGLLFVAGVSVLAIVGTTPPIRVPGPTITRTVPGPTTTVSYLVEVTVTPGVDYGY